MPPWMTAIDDLSTPMLALLCALLTIAVSTAAEQARYSSTVHVVEAAEQMGHELRGRLMDRLCRLSLRFHHRHRSGDLVTRLTSDVLRVEDAAVAWWETAVPEGVLVVATLIALAVIDPVMALTGVLVCPLLAWVVAERRRKVRQASQLAREQEGRLATLATDLLRNMHVVQAFSQRPRVLRLFGADSELTRRRAVEASRIDAELAPLSETVLAAGSGLVLLVGVLRVSAGGMTLGAMLVAISYLASLYAPVRALSRMTTVVAKGAASGRRIAEVLDSTDEVTEAPGAVEAPPLRNEVRVRGLQFGYHPDRPVISGLDLRLRAGESVAITGVTGIGKSTLLALMLRLHDPQQGSISWDGTDLRELQLMSLRRRIGYVPQESWFVDGTIAANIALAADGDVTTSAIEAAGQLCLVDEFVAALPDGYQTPVGEGGLALSGGQRRRIALARAVLDDRDLLLLDEPTSGLDKESAQLVMTAVLQACAGRTVIVVTHDPDLAARTDRQLRLAPRTLDLRREPADARESQPALQPRR